MKGFYLLILIILTAACTHQLENSTDIIAGYWSGEVAKKNGTAQENPTKDIGILIIPGCTTGKVCGKYTEDEFCPGVIILMEVDGRQYNFLTETTTGSTNACGSGDFRRLNLELRSDGRLDFNYRNGDSYYGILSSEN